MATRNRDSAGRSVRVASGLVLVKAKLTPPPRRPHLVPRPRVALKLARAVDCPLTIVRADAGYGKTTAPGALAESFAGRCFWYSLAVPDGDPLLDALNWPEPTLGSTQQGWLSLRLQAGIA